MKTKEQNSKGKTQRNNRGITLVALVITIILLLILAGVAINMAINSDGLFGKANESAKRWNEAVDVEENEVSKFEGFLYEWEQENNIVRRGELTLKVGDVVNYDETKNQNIEGLKNVNWKVLGAEKGRLLLMSAEDIDTLELNGKEGYLKGIQQLNNICEKYGNGEKGNGARCINVDDINRVTGYKVEEGLYDSSTATYKIYGYGQLYEYNKVTEYNCGHFQGNEWVTGKTGIQSNYYSYYPTTLTSSDTDPERGLLITSEEYKMLFKNEDGTNSKYWLADQFVRALAGYINYGLRLVDEDEVQRSYLITAGNEGAVECGVRAVVYLKPNTQFTKDEVNGWWNIK